MTRSQGVGAAVVAIATLCLCPQSAFAQFTNGGFEAGGGSFTGWSRAGDTLIAGASLGTGPVEGTHDALLATATDGSINPDVPAGQGVTAAQLEALMGVNAGTLQGVGNGTPVLGSVIVQNVSVASGFGIAFDWDFLTNQVYNDGTPDSYPPSLINDDFSFVSITPTGNPNQAVILKLADVFYGYVNDPSAPGGFITGFTITPATNPFISETGFHTFNFTPANAGSYTIGIGVLHVTTQPDNGINSALLVDNARLVAVPEPATCVALAALTVGLLRRRNRRGQP